MFVWASHYLKDATLRKLHWFLLQYGCSLPALHKPSKTPLMRSQKLLAGVMFFKIFSPWFLLGEGLAPLTKGSKRTENFARICLRCSVQFCHSVVSNSLWPHGLQHARLPFTNSQSLLKLMSIESVIPSNHLVLCCPLLLLPSIFLSIRVFSNESVLCIRWPKYWSFSFSISPSNKYSGLISLKIDWFDLLAVQGTFKSLLQHHHSKASILWHSAFLMVQLSHPYMTTGKTIALTRWTFVGKVMSLLFNMLSRFVIPFLPRSKRFLISWLQSPSAMILEPKKIKSVTISMVSPSICHDIMGPDLLSFKPAFSLSSFTFIKRFFNSSSLSAIRVVSSAYLRLLIFLPAILIPICASSSLTFHVMYSAYKLNKQSDNIQPCYLFALVLTLLKRLELEFLIKDNH